MLEIMKTTDKNNVIIKVKGRIDTDNASHLASTLQESVSHTTNEVLVLDCEELQYMSSAGLRLLLQTRKQVGEERFKLINVTETLKEILVVTGFDNFLKIDYRE